MSSNKGHSGLKRRLVAIIVAAAVVGVIRLLMWYVHGHPMAVLTPAGPIGAKERHLMAIAIILSAIVVIPVFIMTTLIAVKYREGNPRKQKYTPDWDHSRLYETIWWGIPIIIIGILSVITWQSSHELDPYKALASSNKPIHVQVVALDWKWLFIYPDQGVASVNEVAMPVNTPVDFEITSDTVMNSFWIPNLGSQIYAMPGMDTLLHLEATKMGSFAGSSANISGKGFAGMKFTAHAMSTTGFDSWVQTAHQANQSLSVKSYMKLAQPTTNNAVTYYKTPANNLYDNVIMQYMMPGMTLEGMSS